MGTKQSFIAVTIFLLFGESPTEAQEERPYVSFKRDSDSYKKPDWGYVWPNGPNVWRERYPQCGGLFQSPIALPKRSEADRHEYVPKGENNYNVPREMDIVFSGNKVQLQLTESDDIPIPDSAYFNVTQRYSLYKIILHWGPNDGVGGEHSVGGYNFALEVPHLFYDTKYRTPAEASKYPGGILQNILLYRVDPNKPPTFLNTKLVDTISQINGTTDKVTCKWTPNFPSWRFFRGIDYYTYKGSLSYPPCTPTRVNVFVTPDTYTDVQMAQLRSLITPTGEKTTDNRPSQPYDKRKVTYVSRDPVRAKSDPEDWNRSLHREHSRSNQDEQQSRASTIRELPFDIMPHDHWDTRPELLNDLPTHDHWDRRSELLNDLGPHTHWNRRSELRNILRPHDRWGRRLSIEGLPEYLYESYSEDLSFPLRMTGSKYRDIYQGNYDLRGRSYY